MTGSPCGRKESEARFPDAIGVFIGENGAYTTVASAVAMLVVLALTFSVAVACWSLSRAGDVQSSADATALAGSNVVSSYVTAATVVDASVLSLGLAGMSTAAVGTVALFVPGAQAAAETMIESGLKMIQTRNRFAASAADGLATLEKGLPALVAAQSARVCAAQGSDTVSYTGVALAVPATSASDLSVIDEDQIDAGALEDAAGDLAEAAASLDDAQGEVARAREKAWLADCGSEGPSMRERASSLTELSDAENPDYASSITWRVDAGLERARAYYRWRLDHEAPQGESVEERADSAARAVFYELAVDALEEATIVDEASTCAIDMPYLPRNAEEMRETAAYTDARWPSTVKDGKRTLHYGTDCPGATGEAGPLVSLSDIDEGKARECSVCGFSIGDVAKVPAASTSIDNGFEYHLRAYTQALEAYERARLDEIALEEAARDDAADTGDAFEDAFQSLAVERPQIAPPGRYGCVALVASGEVESPEVGGGSLAAQARVPKRGAVAAAVLAPDEATAENNVLSSFFSSLEERCGSGGAVGLVDSVMDLWGRLLVSYGDAAAGVDELMSELLGGLDGLGGGAVAEWLADRLEGIVGALGFEPADLRLKKPVLTNSSNVLEAGGAGSVADVQDKLRDLPIGTTDPDALLRALGYQAGEEILATEVTIAEIPIPGLGSVPLTVRLRDIAGAGRGR